MNLTDAVVGLVRAVSGKGRIERLCSELGWSIDERNGDAFGLCFNCPVIGRRMVYVGNGDEALVMFVVNSHALLDARRLSGDVSNAALYQNSKSQFGKWEPRIGDDGLRFILTYTAIGDGLTPQLFKCICEDMIKHASKFDKYMRDEGWL